MLSSLPAFWLLHAAERFAALGGGGFYNTRNALKVTSSIYVKVVHSPHDMFVEK
jgi:hypothetical protein